MDCASAKYLWLDLRRKVPSQVLQSKGITESRGADGPHHAPPSHECSWHALQYRLKPPRLFLLFPEFVMPSHRIDTTKSDVFGFAAVESHSTSKHFFRHNEICLDSRCCKQLVWHILNLRVFPSATFWYVPGIFQSIPKPTH